MTDVETLPFSGSSPPAAVAPQTDRALTLDLILREMEADQLADSAQIEGLRTTARFATMSTR